MVMNISDVQASFMPGPVGPVLIALVMVVTSCLVMVRGSNSFLIRITVGLSLVMALASVLHWVRTTHQPAQDQARFLDTVPKESHPGGYVSSDQCQSCHPKEYASWHQTFHRTMTQIASPDSMIARFDNQTLTDDDFAYKLIQDGEKFFVDVYTFPLGVKPDLSNPDIPHRLEARYRVGLLTGSHHMQVCWLTSDQDQGNLQKIFPFTWLIEDQRWVHRDAVFLRDPKLKHSQQLWNQNCYRCHSTAAQPRLDPASGQAHTRTAEIGIGCEACHGPAEAHVTFYSNPANRYLSKFSSSPPAGITQPAHLDHQLASHICAQCHSVKWFTDGPDLWKSGFSFRPGQNLDDSTPVVRPTQLDRQPWLKPVLEKSPDKLARQFWPDGQVRVSGREFNGLVESPCYQRGTLSCLSCHQMHGSPPDDQLADSMHTNQACLQCHASLRDNISAHTHHSPNSPGSSCYNCHMPHTTYGLLKAMRSHQIDSPSVQTQLDSTRPNACSLCHLDKPLQWVADQLHSQFGHPSHVFSDERSAVPEGIRLGLSGGPHQRALLAWHLGWEPAARAAQATWFIPLAMELFNDPYVAIRYIAGKTLKSIVPNCPELDYLATRQARDSMLQKFPSHAPLLNPDQISALQAMQPTETVDLAE
jgi:predicted CXXCH cytochrome family protein